MPEFGYVNNPRSAAETSAYHPAAGGWRVDRQRPFDDIVVRLRQLRGAFREAGEALLEWAAVPDGLHLEPCSRQQRHAAERLEQLGRSAIRPILASEYSSASWDIRHSFTTAFNYETSVRQRQEFGGNMNRAVDIVAGGWHANGILTLRTGLPLHDCRQRSARAFGDAACRIWSPGKPERGSGGRPRPNGQWFDLSARR